MKRYVLILISLFLSCAAFAQKDHISFNGIKIGADDFEKCDAVLKSMGYLYAGENNGVHAYFGKFAALKAYVIVKNFESNKVHQLMFIVEDPSIVNIDAVGNGAMRILEYTYSKFKYENFTKNDPEYETELMFSKDEEHVVFQRLKPKDGVHKVQIMYSAKKERTAHMDY